MRAAVVILLFGLWEGWLRVWATLDPATFPSPPATAAVVIAPAILAVYLLRAQLEARAQRRAGLPVTPVKHPMYLFDFDVRLLWLSLLLIAVGFAAMGLADTALATLRLR